MADTLEYLFKIDVFTPDTLPMARLAEYMADVAVLTGNDSDVHFIRVESGSFSLKYAITRESFPKARERVYYARRGQGDSRAIDSIRRLNQKLKQDNGKAVLIQPEGAEIVEFPGRDLADPEVLEVSQETTLDGQVISVGGASDPVPVQVRVGDRTVRCRIAREPSKALSQYYLQGTIRLFGRAKWIRNEDRIWQITEFVIARFEPLDDAPLSEVIKRLRSISGSGWQHIRDPWAELEQLRNGKE